ncbi:hypothetical protein ACSV5S_23270 [Agrobacterium deltaense]|uniref:hypothetical protein n=1 Tax=Agrobacterium deltaense TaxID=1183412 RepID=UPI003FD692CE
MGLLNIIQRMALREKQSIREVSQRIGLSRNTIAKYLTAGTIEPTFKVSDAARIYHDALERLANNFCKGKTK